MALSILCAAITVALTLYVPILTGDAIDYIIDKGLVNFDPVLSIVMLSNPRNMPVIEHHNLVGMHNGSRALRHDK